MNFEKDNPVHVLRETMAEEALHPANDSDSELPRDAAWLRWMKFASIVLVCAVVLGVGFVVEDYIEQVRADSPQTRAQAGRSVRRDTAQRAQWRFFIGAGLGGTLGAIYVVRCIIRKTDP